MKKIPAASGRVWPRVFLGCVLALFCAVAIHKASLAIAPPVYDSLSYYWKAITSLRAIQAGEWLTLMGTQPAMRPPGFLLLNGIIGIDRDVFNFRGFFALNMILPVLLWSLACWIAIPLRRKTPAMLWRKSVAVAALTLLPMFLQFEYNWDIRLASYWGLQDTVLASSAALAMALVLDSLRRGRIFPAAAGFLVSGFTIMIKPAGILVMLAVTGAWILAAFLRWLPMKNPARRGDHLRYCAITLALAVAIQGAIFCAAFFSPYFSKEILEVSLSNQSALVSSTSKENFLMVLARALRVSFGSIWAVILLVAAPVGVVFLFATSKRKSALVLSGLLAAAVILAAALYWWKFLSGTSARYILPFFCMAIVLTLPALWTCWVHRCSSRVGSVIFCGLAGVVLLYSSALAWPGEIPARWQRFLGINLSTGGHRDSVDAGRFLVEKSKEFRRPVVFLQAGKSYNVAFVSGWLMLENLKMEGSFKLLSSFDWRDYQTVPKSQVIHSDFIALDRPRRPKKSDNLPMSSRGDETRVVFSWLAFLDGDSGVTRHPFGKIDILEIVDPKKFEAAFDAVVASKSQRWRREFLELNGYIDGSWQNGDPAQTRFSTTGKNLDAILAFSHDLEQEPLVAFGECVPLGGDPYFSLKPIQNFGARTAVLRIQVTASAQGSLQIFHAPRAHAFSEKNSIWRPVTEGFNEVAVRLPLEGHETWLRIDLPRLPITTRIEKISITLANPAKMKANP